MTAAEILNSIASRVPPRFRTFISKLPIPDGAFDALNEGNTVFLHGEVGAGKTTLGLAIVYQWFEGKLKAREAEGKGFEDIEHKVKGGDIFTFETYLDMMFKIRGSYEEGKAEKMRDQWRRGRLFFLDDLFSGRATDNANEEIFGLMNYRYSNLLPSVVTSNKTPDEIGAIEDRIASRLFGDGSFIIHVQGEDRRARDLKKGVVNG